MWNNNHFLCNLHYFIPCWKQKESWYCVCQCLLNARCYTPTVVYWLLCVLVFAEFKVLNTHSYIMVTICVNVKFKVLHTYSQIIFTLCVSVCWILETFLKHKIPGIHEFLSKQFHDFLKFIYKNWSLYTHYLKFHFLITFWSLYTHYCTQKKIYRSR